MSRNKIAAIVAGVVALCLCGGIVSSCGDHSKPDAKGNPAAVVGSAAGEAPIHKATPAAKPVSPTPPKPKPSPTPDKRAAVLAWEAKNQGLVLNISTTLGELSTDGSQADFVSARRDAVQLKTDIRKARAAGPIPDSQAQALWTKGLGLFEQAADNLIDGIDDGDPALISKAGDEMTDGGNTIEALTARMKSIQ